MPSIQDDRGFNQGFQPSESLQVRMSRRCDYMISRIAAAPGKEVLEIGCGTGGLAYEMAVKTGANVYGTDLCVPFIEQARSDFRLPNLEYGTLDFNSQKDLHGIERKTKFDAIVGNGILHHLYYQLDDSLASLNKLLVPQGRIVFLEPNFFNPYCLLIFNFKMFRKMAKLEPTEMTFTPSFIRKKLEKAGFGEIKIEFRDFLLPGVPGWSIRPLIAIGALLEKVPLLKATAQSIYISATRKG